MGETWGIRYGDESSFLPVSKLISIIQYPFYLLGLACWLVYPFYSRIRRAILFLLVTGVIVWFAYLFNGFSVFAGQEYSLTGKTYFWKSLAGILQVAGFYMLILQWTPGKRQNEKIHYILLAVTGFIYSLLVLTSTDYFTLCVSLGEGIIWMIALSGINMINRDKSGLGLFLGYGIFSIFAIILHLLPFVGGYFAVVVQITSYLILALGCFYFRSNAFFSEEKSNGMLMFGIASGLLAINTLLFVIPVIGGTLSALILCCILMPVTLIAWYKAIKTQ